MGNLRKKPMEKSWVFRTRSHRKLMSFPWKIYEKNPWKNHGYLGHVPMEKLMSFPWERVPNTHGFSMGFFS